MSTATLASFGKVERIKSSYNVFDLLPSFVNDARNDGEVEEISADGNGKVTTVGPRRREIIGTMTNEQRMIFLNAAASTGKQSSMNLFFSQEHPFLSVMLTDNGQTFRLEGQHECLSIDGCSFSLRKFGRLMRLTDFVSQGMMHEEHADFLKGAVGKRNIIVSGGTRCGKTTFLKAVLEEIQDTVRWIAIEKNIELQQPHFGYRIHVNKITTFEDAMQSALRSNPTLLVISEINSPDSAFAYVEAAMSGHVGASTIHAKSADKVVDRMKMRLSRYNVPDDYIEMACEVVVQITLNDDNSRYVTEIIGM